MLAAYKKTHMKLKMKSLKSADDGMNFNLTHNPKL